MEIHVIKFLYAVRRQRPSYSYAPASRGMAHPAAAFAWGGPCTPPPSCATTARPSTSHRRARQACLCHAAIHSRHRTAPTMRTPIVPSLVARSTPVYPSTLTQGRARTTEAEDDDSGNGGGGGGGGDFHVAPMRGYTDRRAIACNARPMSFALASRSNTKQRVCKCSDTRCSPAQA